MSGLQISSKCFPIHSLYTLTPPRDFIHQNCWLVNTTGKPNSFQPIDLLQEHNVRDIKVSSAVTCYLILLRMQYTFAASGPNVSWDYIGKISASIPCQRRVKDHVEQSLNHFCRGKSHTSPGKEEDIARLQESYRDSRIHQKIQGRKIDPKSKSKDYLANGTQEQAIVNVINRWSENRIRERSSEDFWEPEST